MSKRLRLAIGIATAAIGAVALLGAQGAAAATTIEVANTNDSGTGSLRAAINQANQLAGPDHILIEATGTIPLRSKLPTLTTAMVIRGPGPSDLSLDGSAVPYAALDVHPGMGQPGYCYAPARRCRITLRGLSIDHAGAGILFDRGTLNVIDTTVSDNDNGIEEGCCAPHRLHVIDSTLSGNDTGIVGPEAGQPTGLLRTTLRGNRVGIENSNAPLYVSKSTLIDNHFGISDQFGTVVINRSTLYENDGVAVSSSGSSIPRGVVKITQSTLMSGDSALAIIVGRGDVWTLRSTIVAKNDLSPYRNCSGHVHSRGFNIADDGSCGLGRQSDHPSTEPLLRPLGDYGGVTKTFALSTTSPAIDAGRVAGTAQTDQRGRPRRVDYPGVPLAVGGDNSDIGAFELQAP